MTKNDKMILKTTLTLGFPIILQELINSLVNLLDVFMVGKLGENEIAAVSTGNELLFLFSLLVFGVVSGSAVFIGQFWGKKDLESLHKTIGLCGILSLVASVIFFIPSQFFPGALIGFYIKDPIVYDIGIKYLKIISFTFFLNAIITTINGSMKSIGQTKIPFVTSLVALFSNFIFNYIFIFILKKGVEGAAIATIISRVIELFIQLLLVVKLKMPIYAKFKDYLGFDFRFVKSYAKIVVPVVLNEVMWSSGVTLYRKAYGNLGSQALAANAITAPIQQIFMIFGIGLGSATGILIANSLGAGERDLAIQYSRKSSLFAVVSSCVMGVLLLLTSKSIINFYEVSEATKISAQKIIYVMCIGLIIKTFNYTAIVGVLRNGGDTLFCLLVDGLAVWFVGVPLALLGSYYFQLPVYWVFALAYSEEVVKFAVCLKRVLSNKWANILVDDTVVTCIEDV